MAWNSLFNKTFNACLVCFIHEPKVTAHCNHFFRGLQRKSKSCPGLFVLLQVGDYVAIISVHLCAFRGLNA